MSVEYHVSEQDCRDFLSRSVKAKMQKLYWIAAAILLVLFCLLALVSPYPSAFALISLVIFLVYLALSAVLLKAIVNARGKQLVGSFGPEYFNTPKSLTLTEDGMEYRSVFETAQYVTRAVEKISRDDRFVTVAVRGNLKIFIPAQTPGLADFYEALLAKTDAPQNSAK